MDQNDWLKTQKRRRERDPARVKTWVDELNGRTHGPDPTRKDVTSAIKRRATEIQETTRQIINTAVSNVSKYTASQLPSVRHIRRAVRHHKKNAGYPLSIPPSLNTMTIPQQYQVTHSNEPFLLFDSGIDRHNRIPIYSTETNLRALSIIGHWFADVHLKLPLNFYLLSFHHPCFGR